MTTQLVNTADDLLALALQWQDRGGAAIATVVETWGSAPRPAGSRLVCNAAGEFAGSVSGGCVEVAVLQAAGEVISGAPPRVLSFGVSDEQAWSVGLACGGRIRVFVESLAEAPRRAAYQALLALQRSGAQGVLELPLEGRPPRVLADVAEHLPARQALTTDLAVLQEDEVLLVPQNPPLRLLVVGAVHIAEYLSRFAQDAGYAVTVLDPRSTFLRAARFPGALLVDEWPQQGIPRLAPDARTAAVLLTHDPKIDDPALHAVLATPAFYVGALGSGRTHARRLERLAGEGLGPTQLARIHGPAGLSIKARTPAEIAISVLAQMTGVLRGALP